MNNKKNIFSGILCQILSMLSGLILPRLIIDTFGSEVNGLISSITQFVSFISLLEGGLGAVVLAELYKPIEEQDFAKVKAILSECQRFFYKLGLLFIGYSCILAIIYPLIINCSQGYIYTSSLVLILSFSTLIRYMFSLTNSLYLQASQKLYIVNLTSALLTICNLIVAIVIIKFLPEIHVLKIAADVLFLLQPIILKRYVEKKVHIDLKVTRNKSYSLRNRWNGFAQNFAYFITMNTDIVIVSIVIGVTGASVYSIYMLAINALRIIISMISNSYQSALGKYYVSNDINLMKTKTISFDRLNTQITLILFNTCLLLINPFVSLYTDGVADANYYQPIFALIMVMANMFYCIREPYRYVILAAGKFKETNMGAIIEAVINIVISLLLVYKYGLVGIAIGTLIAVVYRYIYFIVFLKKNILKIPVKTYIFRILCICLISGLNIYIYFSGLIEVNSILDFIVYGCVIVFGEGVVTISLFLFEKKLSYQMTKA